MSAFLALAFIVSGCSAAVTAPKFDSERAFAILKKQCDLGPRPLGSKAHEETRAYLIRELKRYAGSVESQDFEHRTDRTDRTYRLSNIIARFGTSSGPAILLCAHWDTRPTADQELDPAMRIRPIVGANDGASGVAVLLELARMFKERPPSVPVTVVLFDGEDFGPTSADMFLGSRHFAATLNKSAFRYGILLDMVGDKELALPRENYSQRRARSVVDRVWNVGKKLGYRRVFTDEVPFTVIDDHLPLLEKGIPCVDVIDFDYAYWHTTQDTVDKCSPESLRIVGETIASVVYSERAAD
jgi:Zn-dependent M28 family amino/carboxypeptidase